MPDLAMPYARDYFPALRLPLPQAHLRAQRDKVVGFSRLIVKRSHEALPEKELLDNRLS